MLNQATTSTWVIFPSPEFKKLYLVYAVTSTQTLNPTGDLSTI